MDTPAYNKGERVAVIINRTNAEAASIPYLVASGIVGDPASDGKTWVHVSYVGGKFVPQMVAAQDIVGHTLHQPDGVNLPAEAVKKTASSVPGVMDDPATN